MRCALFDFATRAPSRRKERKSSRSNASPIVPPVAGTFPPLRTALGLDEHGYSSSVLERIITAAARFSSFRDATCAVQMSGIDISESPVRRLAHEVGRERIDTRDRKVIEQRRRQLRARADVIPEVVVVEVDGGAFAPGPPNAAPVFTTRRTRKTKSPVWPR